MTTQQPDALRLADELNGLCIAEFAWPLLNEAAAELRRLHDVLGKAHALNRIRSQRITELERVNAQLLEACETLAGLPGTEEWLATLRLAVEQARAAIAAAKEMK